MHPSLTSREHDLAALPKHQRLLSNLGILAKSEAHASLLHSTLRTAGNAHAASHEPANPQRAIQRSATSDIDREAERKYGERMTALQRQRAKRGDSRQDAEHLRRMSEARANGGINDKDDIEEGSGSSLSKSLTPGAFQRLRVGLHRHMAKALALQDHTDDFATRYGIGSAHVAADAGRAPVVKTAPISKTIQAAGQRLAKALGVSPVKQLNQKMASIARSLGNEQLAKSIGIGGAVRGLRMAAPKYSAAQIEHASMAALQAGVLDGETASVVANLLAMGGAAAIPNAVIRLLEGQD
ncbi:hypothetical protein R75465_07973 [Paraburkholderia aspalathi]|nr:hypothetical protein R75465_07973 [Paraburkholderia aspalathi]